MLAAVSRAADYLDPNSSGGAHTDVMRIDADALSAGLAGLAGLERGDPAHAKLEGMARQVADRFILKRGKVEDFVMKVVGPRENRIPRDLMSRTFGPFGYNLMPTVGKVVTGSQEAAREIPYFAFGDRQTVLAPDVLRQLSKGVKNRRRPRNFLKPEGDLFLSFLSDSGEPEQQQTVYDLLSSDPYFKGRVESFDDLTTYQRFVRSSPITREMEGQLSTFFDAPITVGVRDVVRWAMGSRHPNLGWDKARETIKTAFGSHGDENFLPAEVTYYALDLDHEPEHVASLLVMNRQVVLLFARDLQEALKRAGFVGLGRAVVLDLARQVLDFHHGYPLYELEPYHSVVSLSSLKLVARIAAALGMLATKMRLPESRNFNLDYLGKWPGRFVQIARQMDERDSERLLAAVEDALHSYASQGGTRDQHGNVWTYRRLPRTFYSFQEKAFYPGSVKGRVEETFPLEKLHSEQYRSLLADLPELSEKLTVFFTLVYRYYKDTGFVPDLRPQNAGRDIFLLGIWGYVSDNLLITIWRDDSNRLHGDVSFVDNRDQFKEYRRNEDRKAPMGQAKHALRLTGPLIEPAMLRAIGLFTDRTWRNRSPGAPDQPTVVHKYATQGLDIAQEVIHSAIENAFDSGRAAVEDFVDDAFTAVKKWVKPPQS